MKTSSQIISQLRWWDPPCSSCLYIEQYSQKLLWLLAAAKPENFARQWAQMGNNRIWDKSPGLSFFLLLCAQVCSHPNNPFWRPPQVSLESSYPFAEPIFILPYNLSEERLQGTVHSAAVVITNVIEIEAASTTTYATRADITERSQEKEEHPRCREWSWCRE